MFWLQMAPCILAVGGLQAIGKDQLAFSCWKSDLLMTVTSYVDPVRPNNQQSSSFARFLDLYHISLSNLQCW